MVITLYERLQHCCDLYTGHTLHDCGCFCIALFGGDNPATMASALDYDAVLWDFCRSESYCDLNLTDPVCGYDSVAPVDALSFTVQDNVQVKAVAYKILYDCDGGQCSYTS